ncbi:MAG: caspase family protein, partial [Bacteroidales bacterium]|nr:caspase family protein [Bacteroidales bacterium]
INYPKLQDLEICGTLPIIERLETNTEEYAYRITPQKSGFEYLEVYVNEKKVYTFKKAELIEENGIYLLNIKYEDIAKHFISGIENTVKVVAVVKQSGSEIRSRGVSFKYENKNTVKANPRLYIVMVGINDYKDVSLNLEFPADDAIDLGNAIRFSAEKFLGDTNVVVYIINSNVKPGTGYTTPEKEGIRKAFEEIGTKAGPEDVILLFFAGHGVMQGEKDKVFTLLTAEASPENQIGISTTELQNWLSFEGPHKILANKTILIFDTCNSGQATKELMALARSDDDSEKIRQVEDLRDKSGFFILTASAPNQYAYEFPQYNHGLLTYCLLYVLKNNPEILDDGKYLNVQKWFLETESYLDLLVKDMGYQQDAQPFGTSNIRIGIVDDDLKQSIVLVDEKPVVVCANVMNDATFDDDMHLKVLINSKLSEISERATDKSIIYPRQETENANKINIRYSVNGDKIKCEIRLIKQGEVLLNTSITGDKNNLNDLVSRIIAEVVKYAM